ncbi:hypothetical protein FT663_04060 [Candidozyma haemuli var. vulneris]|uniref:GTP-binding RHO-like protein n=1 Tax=Candidozyma haemuli TaxID=45357 RepID=A0A2V1AMH4_9ASCO|nr:hypothetical protein CXQ85_001204 [[Candida] haemuloni]KAF3988302.1 hypothetical protein FT662_03498 [[Candida] haemuloni var. vulneris]KAF3988377.1 hypothetical protein FT663_04060 [[Candida] haemuloni var. vulneris]PVH18912.1 hypothetical protein CXQ85_001204 [[Candida] haemuloni]
MSFKSPLDLQNDYVNPYNRTSPTRSTPRSPRSPLINDSPVIPKYKMLPQMTKKSSYNMKLVVVGDGGCGKTCLLVSYAQNKFPEIYVPTIFENYVTSVQAPNGKTIELALWDTAGQEEYDRLRPLSYPDSDIIVICFAVDNLVSLQNIKDTWFPEVNHFCPGVPVLLVGTKSDLAQDMDPDMPLQLAHEINAIGYISCSAKSMFNIQEVFNFALNHFQKSKEMEEQVEKSRNRLSRVMGGSHSRNHSRGNSRGGNGHSRTGSNKSAKHGHFPHASVGSSVLLDSPLVEDDYQRNPYQSSPNPQSKYNEDELAFARRKKNSSRKCTIL